MYNQPGVRKLNYKGIWTNKLGRILNMNQHDKDWTYVMTEASCKNFWLAFSSFRSLSILMATFISLYSPSHTSVHACGWGGGYISIHTYTLCKYFSHLQILLCQSDFSWWGVSLEWPNHLMDTHTHTQSVDMQLDKSQESNSLSLKSWTLTTYSISLVLSTEYFSLEHKPSASCW